MQRRGQRREFRGLPSLGGAEGCSRSQDRERLPLDAGLSPEGGRGVPVFLERLDRRQRLLDLEPGRASEVEVFLNARRRARRDSSRDPACQEEVAKLGGVPDPFRDARERRKDRRGERVGEQERRSGPPAPDLPRRGEATRARPGDVFGGGESGPDQRREGRGAKE